MAGLRPALAREDEIEYAVQINGKLRGRIVVPADSPKDMVQAAALADDKIRSALDGKPATNVIVVLGKLVNVVVKE